MKTISSSPKHLWLTLTGLWSLLICIFWGDSVEPLAGIPFVLFVAVILMHAVLVCIASFLYLKLGRKKLAFLFLLPVVFFVHPPKGDKAISFRMKNTTEEVQELVIGRLDEPSRIFHATLKPNEEKDYTTAPGIWDRREAKFKVLSKSAFLVAPVDDFDDASVVVEKGGLKLVGKDESLLERSEGISSENKIPGS